MKHLRKIIPVFFVLVIATACAENQSVNNPDDIRAIEEMSAARADAFNRGNAADIAVHFTEDGKLMAPGSTVSIGREAVETYYQQIFEQYETVLDSYYEEVQVSGDLAFGRGFAEVSLIPVDGGDTITTTSKYINILERQEDGTWLTTHDIWNNNE